MQTSNASTDNTATAKSMLYNYECKRDSLLGKMAEIESDLKETEECISHYQRQLRRPAC